MSDLNELMKKLKKAEDKVEEVKEEAKEEEEDPEEEDPEEEDIEEEVKEAVVKDKPSKDSLTPEDELILLQNNAVFRKESLLVQKDTLEVLKIIAEGILSLATNKGKK